MHTQMTETSMESEAENLEKKLTSLLTQLQIESGILERMVYKNKNQHRRCSYFRYLLKVRRDTRLLKAAKVEELLANCFHVINGKKPKQKVHLLESLKRRKCEGGKHNFMERLLGAARLLSEMAEPIMKAATEISTLLAQSFFVGFSLTVLAVLARLRVLVQQVLLDIVSVFNIVSSLSRKKQDVKIAQQGLEVYREFYPINDEFSVLECKWESDKFVLHESTQKVETGTQDKHMKVNASSVPELAVQYQSIESILGEDEHDNEKENADKTDQSGGASVDQSIDEKNIEEYGSGTTILSSSNKSDLTKVAFLSVKKPEQVKSSSDCSVENHLKENVVNNEVKEDPFFTFLTCGNVKDSLF